MTVYGAGGGGPPTKLTPELGERIVEGVLTGLYISQVSLDCGVHPNTVKRWVQMGLEEEAREPFKSFAQRFIQADIAVERRTILRIRRGADPQEHKTIRVETTTDAEGKEEVKEVEQTVETPGDWKAAAFFAERRWPKRWGAAIAKSGETGDIDMDLPKIQEAAAARGDELDALLGEPPPELEEAILRNKDRILALLGAGPEGEKKAG